MRWILFALLWSAFVASSQTVSAEVFHFINGEQVTAGEAQRRVLQDPNTRVLKVTANWTRIKDSTGRLNKVDDASLEDLNSKGASSAQ